MTLGMSVLLLLSLISLVLVGYIALTMFFVDAARKQPPA